MKHLVIMAICVISTAVLAEEGASTNDYITLRSGKKMLRSEFQAMVKRGRMRATGGTVTKENSGKGWLVVLNAQKKVSTEEIVSVRVLVDQYVHIGLDFKDSAPLTLSNIGDSIRGAKGVVGVGIIEDPALPAFLVAPESGWAIVNVTKLGEGNPDNKTLVSRVRKEVLRGMAFVTGCAYMTQADPVMRDVAKTSDLDALGDVLGGEILMHMRTSAPRYGLVPWYVTTYKQACQEGWAPQPTNEFQKAIWDKIHAIPQKPIKIEYNEKRDKGK